MDDGSRRLIAELRSRKLLTDEEWTRIKQSLREALAFLSGPQKNNCPRGRWINRGWILMLTTRNADWLQISAAACRLTTPTARHLSAWVANVVGEQSANSANVNSQHNRVAFENVLANATQMRSPHVRVTGGYQRWLAISPGVVP